MSLFGIETITTAYLPKVLASGFRVSVLGLYKASDIPRLASLEPFTATGQLRLSGNCPTVRVAAEYLKHESVWVHALREGFGRCVVEGRHAGSSVLCTGIPEFAGLRDDDVSLYRIQRSS